MLIGNPPGDVEKADLSLLLRLNIDLRVLSLRVAFKPWAIRGNHGRNANGDVLPNLDFCTCHKH